MKKLSTIFFLLFAMLGFSACSDWLDVRPDTEQKDKDQFSTEQGFYDAIVGAYMEMADRAIYGERMTMTNIESLANQWLFTNSSQRNEDVYLSKHDYENVTYAQAAIQTIYAKLFNVIAQANMIIKNVDERGDVILDPAVRRAVRQHLCEELPAERPGAFKKHDYVTGIEEVGSLPEDVEHDMQEQSSMLCAV